jgi:uncharacterized protein (DUF488 family)
MPQVIYTIGHSTRSFEEFATLLRAHGISQLADVRRFPGSRRHPQFSREHLKAAPSAHGVTYRHFPGLGGFRKPRRDSPNVGWCNASFRGYADHMQTGEFSAELQDLLAYADLASTAVMCAEAAFRRCHRSLLADALAVRGVEVLHIQTADAVDTHKLCDFARTDGHAITYVEDRPVPPRVRGNQRRLKMV